MLAAAEARVAELEMVVDTAEAQHAIQASRTS